MFSAPGIEVKIPERKQLVAKERDGETLRGSKVPSPSSAHLFWNLARSSLAHTSAMKWLPLRHTHTPARGGLNWCLGSKPRKKWRVLAKNEFKFLLSLIVFHFTMPRFPPCLLHPKNLPEAWVLVRSQVWTIWKEILLRIKFSVPKMCLSQVLALSPQQP